MDFLDSDYNSEGDGENLAINHYGFSEGYVIPTNMQQDEIMRQTFEDISKNEEYRLIGNNCVTTVQRAMEAAGLTHYEQKVFNISINLGIRKLSVKVTTLPPLIPAKAFKRIKESNPKGAMIYRTK